MKLKRQYWPRTGEELETTFFHYITLGFLFSIIYTNSYSEMLKKHDYKHFERVLLCLIFGIIYLKHFIIL